MGIKVTSGEARKLGLRPAKRKFRVVAKQDAARKLFLEGCKAHGIPEPVEEYQFAPPRKWKFDWCWNGELALEIQGGLFIGGRHVNGAALLREHEKLNEAAIRGWLVLYCTPADVESGAVFPTIKRALQGE